MNEFLRCRRDVFLGIKAYQNIRASLSALERLCALVDSNDYLLLSSIFYMGVIKYAKPFLTTKSDSSLVAYPIKHLKIVYNFSLKIHKHLLAVRNTLVAHDDFEQIEPRLLFFGLNIEGLDYHIPTSILVANKCVSYPSDLEGSQKIKDHIAATLLGVSGKLVEDIKKIRLISIEHPEQGTIKYSKSYGKENIPVGGKHLKPPDCMNDEWLNPAEPDFSEIHNGFRYEKITIKLDFHGPERIRLPNGYEIEIIPK